MKLSENGFTMLELVIVLALSASLALSATMFTFHSFGTTQRTNDHLTAVTSAENAGYWISRDASMADRVITDNLTSPAILILKWTDWGYDTDNTYYSATYSIESVSNGVGQLKRRLQDSEGTDQTTRIADYIYFNADDPSNSTNVTYQSPTISLRVAARYGSASETRSYQIYRRPNF